MGSDVQTTFVNLSKELLRTDLMTESWKIQVCIYFCRRVHIFGINSPTMEGLVDGKDVHVIDTGSW